MLEHRSLLSVPAGSPDVPAGKILTATLCLFVFALSVLLLDVNRFWVYGRGSDETINMKSARIENG